MSTQILDEGVMTLVAGFSNSSYTAQTFALSNGGYVVTVRQANTFSQGLVYLFDSDRNFVSQFSFPAFRSFIDQGAETTNGFVVGVTNYDGGSGVILPGDVYMYRFDSTGKTLGAPILVNDVRDQQGQDSVADRNIDFTALKSGQILAAWSAGGDIAIKLFDPNGDAATSQRVINTTGSGLQDNAHLATLDNGGAVVAWDGGVSGTRIVKAQVLSSAGDKIGTELVLGSQLSYLVEVLSSSQGFKVFWLSQQNLHYQEFDFSGTKVGPEVVLGIAAATVRSVDNYGDDGIIVSWVHRSNASMVQVFGPDGGSTNLQPMSVDPASPLVEVYALQLADGSIETVARTSLGSIVRTQLSLGERPIDLVGTNAVDYIEGDQRDNILRGGDGGDYLYGLAGDDTLIGGFGADYLHGGIGNDTASYTDSTVGVFANLADGKADGASGQDTLISIENLTGSSFADTLIGDDGPNRLLGGAGDDILQGGRGGDHLDGGGGTDTASYVGDFGGVFVNLTLGRGFTNFAFDDIYISIENVIGSSFDDFLIGDTGTNRLDGGPGNDTIIGALGADILIGGGGTDLLSFEDNSGTVFVNLKTGQGFNNGAQGDTFTGFENIIAGLFDDTLIGDDGPNRLDGALGADTLVGNGGADVFVFNHAPGVSSGFSHPNSSANVEKIFDFKSGEDKLEINASAFGGGLIGGSLPASAFVIGTDAQDADDRFIYDPTTGYLYFDADGNGSGSKTLFAAFPNLDAIAATDFVIVTP